MLAPIIDYTSDPNYVIVDGVPILDEHELFIPGNKEKGTQDQRLKITPQVLQHICDNNNRRVRETGDTVQLVLGHTTDDAPEDQQPEILGEADNFRLGPLFNTGRQAILSRWKLSKDPEKLKKVKGPTRRSVELWTDRWEIDPIAILKSTPPERDLGVLRLSAMKTRSVGADGVVRYKLTKYSLPVTYAETPMQPNPAPSPNPGTPTVVPAAPGSAPDPALVQAVAAAVMQSDSFVQLIQQQQQMMQMLQGLQQPAMPGMGQPGMGQQPPGMGQPGMGDPMQAMLAQLMGGMGQPDQGQEPPGEQRDEDDKVNMQAGSPGMSFNPAFPGGGNTFLPTVSAMTSDRDRTRSPRPQMYQQNGQPVLPTPGQPGQQGQQTQQVPSVVHQLQPPAQESANDQIVRLTRERDAAILLCRQMQVFVELTALQGEGIELDVREELPFLTGLSDNDRAIRYQHMRQRYRRRNEQPTQPAVPGLPGFVGNGPVVPVQYQRTQAQQQAQDAQVTQEERDAVIRMQCDERDRTGNVPDFKVCLSRVRAGRNGYRAEQVY